MTMSGDGVVIDYLANMRSNATMNNMKLVQEFTEAKIAQGIVSSGGTQNGYAYAVGCLEVVLAGVLTELEIRNPKTYEGKVAFIKDLIEMSKKETN